MAARPSCLQVRRPRVLRAEERKRREPQPGRLFVRRHDRRPDGVPELPARQRAGACTACTYTEAERDIDLGLRSIGSSFTRRNVASVPRLTLDYGVRYALYPPITDKNNQLVTFDPTRMTPHRRRRSPTPPGTLIDRTQGNLLVGIIQGGDNSPYGDSIYKFQKNTIQPRVGSPRTCPAMATTSSAAPLVSITISPRRHLRAELVHYAADRQQRGVQQPHADQPRRRSDADDDRRARNHRVGHGFKNPRTMQWNAGVTRRLSRDAAEASYVGSHGDNLIRPTDINYPEPVAVVQLQNRPAAFNPVRPYRSYGAITFRETTARSRYHGLLTSTRLDFGSTGSVRSITR